jgi:hypothetical protein
MDAILKRLASINQVLLVVLALCFVSCYGRRASTVALDVARDLEALQKIKGMSAAPERACGSPELQQALDEELRAGPANDGYGRVRESLLAFLKEKLRFSDADIAQAKGGGAVGPRAYFLVNPELALPEKTFCLGVDTDSVARRALLGAPDAPDSVETILARSQVYARSTAIEFPVEWVPPADPTTLVPASCLAVQDTMAPAPHSPPSLVSRECLLTAIVFDGKSLLFFWATQRQVQRTLDAADRKKASAAKAERLEEKRPFLLAHMPSVEDAWLQRIEAIASSDDRRRILVERYGGLSIDTAVSQSEKAYSDLVGSVALFGWSLLPQWFPLAVDVVFLGCLASILVSCFQARELTGWNDRAGKIVALESGLFLSLINPTATFITWALLPLLAVGMTVPFASGRYVVAAELGLALVASTLGATACVLFWRKAPAGDQDVEDP